MNRRLREKLPPAFQYGWKYVALVRVLQVTLTACGGFLLYSMFYKPAEVGVMDPKMYEIVLDSRTGRPKDIVYKPLADAAARAEDRAHRQMR